MKLNLHIGLFLIVLLPALTGCSISRIISASSAEKREAFREHAENWDGPGSPGEFGRDRSVQVVQAARLQKTAKGWKVNSGSGMATLISADGYALTAAHVVAGRPKLDSIFATVPPHSIPIRMQLTTITVQDAAGKVTAELDSSRMTRIDPRNRKVRQEDISIEPLRVVKLFPNTDLALIKLPIKTPQWFELRDNLPSPDTTAFATGNGLTPFRGDSAGRILKVKPTTGEQTNISSSVPLARGDSGGPLFDGSGKLIGVASEIRLSRLLPWPRWNHSLHRTLSSDALKKLIEDDRRMNTASRSTRK